jgi:hypothetical protein
MPADHDANALPRRWFVLPKSLPVVVLAALAGSGCLEQQACPSGTWQQGQACVAWTDCGPGERVITEGTPTSDRACTACEPGTYCAGGAEAVVACGGGTWDDDQRSATPCAPWRTCAAGQRVQSEGTALVDRTCAACASATFTAEPNLGACAPWRDCQPGAYVSATGTATADRQCAACPSGTLTTVTNQSACLPADACPAGSVQTMAGSASSPPQCSPCEVGTFCAGGVAPREACAAGTWDHDASSATACVPWTDCVPGQRVSSTGSATVDRACEACAAGRFGDQPNAMLCAEWRTCPAGSYVSTLGTAVSDRQCSNCADGTFSSVPNQAACLPRGACPAGTEETSPATSTTPPVCAACEAGTFCPGGAAPKQGCPGGTWDHDASSATACVAWTTCSAGQFVTAAGAPTGDRGCAACAPGTFSTSGNASACAAWTACTPGSFVSAPGTATADRQCTVCSPGSSSTVANQASCLEPGAPENVLLTPGDGTLAVTWADAPDNGNTIAGYRVERRSLGATSWVTVVASTTSRSATASGLFNGTTYEVRVTALTAVGPSANSATATETPRTVPGAPTGVTASLTASQTITVSFSAPSSTGGAAITGYTVMASTVPDFSVSGGSATGSGSPLVVTGLTNGTPYFFRVRATNAAGDGPWAVAAGTVPWTPAMIATALWLDASETGTLTVSGARVQAWNDKSGNGRHLTQDSVGSQPLLLAQGFNGRPTVSFDGVDDLLLRARSDVGSIAGGDDAPWSVATASWYAPAVTEGTLLAFSSSAGGDFFHSLTRSAFGQLLARRRAVLPDEVSVVGPDYSNQFGVLSFVFGGTTASLGFNGGLAVGGPMNVASLGSNIDRFALGALARDTTSLFAACMHSEVLITQGALPQADRQRVEGYLAWKWGLQAQLPANHPHLSGAPVEAAVAPYGSTVSPPRDLAAAPGAGRVTLTWTAPSTGQVIGDYLVEYRAGPLSPWVTYVDGVSTATTATVLGLTSGVVYQFRVSSVAAGGPGAPSSIVSASILASSCAGHLAAGATSSGVYTISAGGQSYDVYCDMTTNGGGWTLVMKGSATSSVFDFNSTHWVTTSTLNDSVPELAVGDAKYRAFNDLAFTSARIDTTNDVGVGSITVPNPSAGSTLRALFAAGTMQLTNAGRAAWLASQAGTTLQQNCNREGFNVGGIYVRARLGLEANQENDCGTSDSVVGIGLLDTSLAFVGNTAGPFSAGYESSPGIGPWSPFTPVVPGRGASFWLWVR